MHFRGPQPAFRLRGLCAAMLALALLFEPIAHVEASEALPALGDASSDDLSPIAERKLGEEIMREAHEAGDIAEDPEATEYLNIFGENLIAHAPPSTQPFEFFLVDSPDINAFALPGGYIGVHSGLIIATQSESELASVMAHEMGHVIQRHIAREIGRQKQNSLIAIAGMVLGMIALSRSNTGDAGGAAMAMSESYAIQDQLKFSRDAEREADRVGFQTLQDSGFDVTGMATFFTRLDAATQLYENGAPEWLRDHPMTTERIADIQNRIRDVHYHQRPDSIDFNLVRARLRVVQAHSVQGVVDARRGLEEQLKSGAYASEAAIHYGIAVAALRQADLKTAQREYDAARKLINQKDALLENFQVDLKLAQNDAKGAAAVAEAARSDFPASRMLVTSYAEALQKEGRHEAAIVFLREQIATHRSEARLYELIATSYAARDQPVLAHKAQAESYYLRGSVHEAMEQLKIARKSGEGDFYEESQIDARMRELEEQWKDLQKEKKGGGLFGSGLRVSAGTENSSTDASASEPSPSPPPSHFILR